MLMIRLQRVGRRNHAEFRLVATEKTRAAKSSNYVEHLGHYNPHTDTVKFNTERVLHWIENGAQVSDTVHNLLIAEKIIEGKKRNVLPKKNPIVSDTIEEEAVESTEEQKDSGTEDIETKDTDTSKDQKAKKTTEKDDKTSADEAEENTNDSDEQEK